MRLGAEYPAAFSAAATCSSLRTVTGSGSAPQSSVAKAQVTQAEDLPESDDLAYTSRERLCSASCLPCSVAKARAIAALDARTGAYRGGWSCLWRFLASCTCTSVRTETPITGADKACTPGAGTGGGARVVAVGHLHFAA